MKNAASRDEIRRTKPAAGNNEFSEDLLQYMNDRTVPTKDHNFA